MTAWDYRTINLTYDKKQKTWVAGDTEKTPTGIQTTLDAYGAQGWELVSLTPERFQAYPDWGAWYIEPVRYRVTFKKPQEG